MGSGMPRPPSCSWPSELFLFTMMVAPGSPTAEPSAGSSPAAAAASSSTSHCGQRPAPGGPAAEQSRGPGLELRGGRGSPRSAWHGHAGPPRGLFGTQGSACSSRRAPRECLLSCSPTSVSEGLSTSGKEELWRAAEQSLTLASFAPLAKRSAVHLGFSRKNAGGNDWKMKSGQEAGVTK
ncbi:hypothetical protein NN561_002834 [Cricetulus griseus]